MMLVDGCTAAIQAPAFCVVALTESHFPIQVTQFRSASGKKKLNGGMGLESWDVYVFFRVFVKQYVSMPQIKLSGTIFPAGIGTENLIATGLKNRGKV